MSYNTRRTGGAADRNSNRAPQTTQVNYHTQQAKPTGAQSANVRGYTTTNVQSYNSAAQPAYTTSQPAYQTNPPLPKAAPPQPAAAPTPATPPQVKQELVTPQGTPGASENGETASTKPFWAGKKKFTKLSNKVKKQRQNAKLRRILNPKTALTFLNELKPGGIKFNMKEEPGWGFTATVEIDGNTYSGQALTVSKAKVQASEHALRDMLLDKMSKASAEVKEEKKEGEESSQDDSMETEEDGEPKAKKSRPPPPEDDLPWGSLAAFALHKLFLEWQRGATELPPLGKEYDDEMSEDSFYARRGPSPGDFGGYPRRFGPPRPGPYPPPRGFGPFPPRGPPFMGMPPRRPAANLPFSAKPAVPASLMPMKKIPEDANQKHPVMLLNQLKPDVVYKETREGLAPNVRFIITVELEGKQYTGEGKNKKEAKKNAAKQALAPLGISYAEGE